MSTAKVKMTNRRLLKTKAASRLSAERIGWPGARVCRRMARSTMDASTTIARNARNSGPIGLWVKEWTELNTPERVMKVPSTVSAKVVSTSTIAQPR